MGATDLVIQLSILALTLLMTFIALHYLATRTSSRKKDRVSAAAQAQTGRHLAQAAHFLSRAHPSRAHFAKLALAETDAAISLSPKDPSPLVLKSRALRQLGNVGPALRALDLALSPPRVRSLPEKERVEALVARAELKLDVNRRRRVDSAIEDLKEAARLGGGGAEEEGKVWCLLGRCYEWKGLKEEARWAFEQARWAQPDSLEAREGLQRLGL